MIAAPSTMRRLARAAAGRRRHGSAERPVPAATADRSAEAFVAAVSGLSALVDGAWQRPEPRIG